jgi:hypothetical protein
MEWLKIGKTGVDVRKLLFSVTESGNLISLGYFRVSLIHLPVIKGNFTRVGSGLTHKYQTGLEKLTDDKQLSLLCRSISEEAEKCL